MKPFHIVDRKQIHNIDGKSFHNVNGYERLSRDTYCVKFVKNITELPYQRNIGIRKFSSDDIRIEEISIWNQRCTDSDRLVVTN